MSKLYAALAAIALLFVLAAPGPASAAERRAHGVINGKIEHHEISSHRRRYYHRHTYAPRYRYVRRYYGPRYYYGPQYRYGYYGYPYYGRPYWGPGIYAGPFGFGIGFGPRWWW